MDVLEIIENAVKLDLESFSRYIVETDIDLDVLWEAMKIMSNFYYKSVYIGENFVFLMSLYSSTVDTLPPDANIVAIQAYYLLQSKTPRRQYTTVKQDIVAPEIPVREPSYVDPDEIIDSIDPSSYGMEELNTMRKYSHNGDMLISYYIQSGLSPRLIDYANNHRLKYTGIPKFIEHLRSCFKTEFDRDIVVYRAINSNVHHKVGEIIEMNYFVSTSVDRDQTVYFLDDSEFRDAIIYHIIVPRGTKVCPIVLSSEYPEEREILLPFGSIYKCISKRVTDASLSHRKCRNDITIYTLQLISTPPTRIPSFPEVVSSGIVIPPPDNNLVIMDNLLSEVVTATREAQLLLNSMIIYLLTREGRQVELTRVSDISRTIHRQIYSSTRPKCVGFQDVVDYFRNNGMKLPVTA